MIKRALSTVALWGAMIVAIYFWKFTALVWIATAFSLMAQYELYNLTQKLGWKAYRSLGLIMGGCLMLVTAWPGFFMDTFVLEADVALVLAITCVLAALFGIRNRQIQENFQSFGGTLLGLLLIPLMMSYFIRIAHLFPNGLVGPMTCLWVVVVAKFSDIGAFLAGSLLGKRKLAPQISPGKTWEGLIGGILLGCATGYLFARLFPDYLPLEFHPWLAAYFAVFIAIMAALSDLFESTIKRQAGVKDSGACIPGIGGVLDLIDSLLLSAPVAYILLSSLPGLP